MTFDRTAEDLGNIVEFGHVNTRVPDQRLATLFYVVGLGLTRDPFLTVGVENMWVNAGTSQFHLPTGQAQVLGGVTALVLPDPDGLARRLRAIEPELAGTLFAFAPGRDVTQVRSPWGNRIRCYAAGERFAGVALGMPYVEMAAPLGSTEAVARFYREILGALAHCGQDERGAFAHVSAGLHASLVFRESVEPRGAFDGAHVQITLADFSGPHRRLVEGGLITEESNPHQYRFEDIVDLANGQVVLKLEHEVRSMRHPMYARVLVNRDPGRSVTTYAPAREALAWHG